MYISAEVLKEEIHLVRRVLLKWEERLQQGFPGIDLPASPENTALFLQQLRSEIALCGDLCHSLAFRMVDEE